MTNNKNEKKADYTQEEIELILGFSEEFDNENEMIAYATHRADNVYGNEFSYEDFQDRFEGHYDNWIQFCKQYVDSCYNLDSLFDEKKSDLGNLTQYLTFDWEKMANDWEQSGDFVEIKLPDVDGLFIFRSNI